jgi:hypothetical protein
MATMSSLGAAAGIALVLVMAGPAAAKKPSTALIRRPSTALVPYGQYRTLPFPRVVLHQSAVKGAPPVRDLLPPGRPLTINARDQGLLKVKSCITTPQTNPDAIVMNKIEINPRAIAARFNLGQDARLFGLYLRVPAGEKNACRGVSVAVSPNRTEFSETLDPVQRHDINRRNINVWATIQTRTPTGVLKYTHVQQDVRPAEISDALSN